MNIQKNSFIFEPSLTVKPLKTTDMKSFTQTRTTNEEKFNSVLEVELELTKTRNSFKGDVSIQTVDGWKTWSGEHGSFDFEEKFGFVIVDGHTGRTN